MNGIRKTSRCTQYCHSYSLGFANSMVKFNWLQSHSMDDGVRARISDKINVITRFPSPFNWMWFQLCYVISASTLERLRSSRKIVSTNIDTRSSHSIFLLKHSTQLSIAVSSSERERERGALLLESVEINEIIDNNCCSQKSTAWSS